MKNSKVLTIIAVMLLIFVAFGAFASCKDGGDDGATVGATTTGAPATTTAPKNDEPEPEPEPANVVVNADLLKNYKIVATHDADVSALIAGIKEKTGVELTAIVDTAGDEVSAKEILVGNTNRKESSAAKNSLSYGIALNGEKFVITYGSDVMLDAAIEYIVSSFVDGSVTLAPDFAYEKEYEMKIDGVGIGEYKIVYAVGDEDGKVAAEFLASEIKKASGVTVNVITDANAKGDYEIIMGTTSRGAAEACAEYYSYKVRVADKSFKLSGYDNYALNNAAYGLLNAIIDEKGDGKTEKLNLTYTLPDYKEYLKNPELLYMRWIAEWQTDSRMLDYNRTIDAFLTKTDRLLTCAHRADGYYYPENSLEGIISYYMMGGDAVELDIQATKDGVLILMHDNNFWRMTNANEFVGKTINGITFPNSYNVLDWTYEQVQYLNLRENKSTETNGGQWTPVTPFKVPTLVEALEFCKGRLLIIPDKTDKWRYVEGDSLIASPNIYLYDAMEAANNYESIVISYGFTGTPDYAVDVQKKIYQKSGVVPYLAPRITTDSSSFTTFLAKKAINGDFAGQVGGHYDSSYATKYPELFKAFNDAKKVMWAWTIEDTDKEGTWQEMYGLGYRMIMNNAYLDLVKYAYTTVSFD